MELNYLIEAEGGTTVFAGTSVPISSLFEFLQDDQTVETFLNKFPLIARHQALGILSAALKMLAGATPKEKKVESAIGLQAQPGEDVAAPPNLVCKYCKEPIFPVRSPQGYLHAYSGAPECITQEPGRQPRASPYPDKETYPAYRGRLIMEMTRSIQSYSDVDSPPEVLELILADARHFADANRLNFEDHHRRSCQIYLDNTKGTRRYS